MVGRRRTPARHPGRRRTVPPVDAAERNVSGPGRGLPAEGRPLVLLASGRESGLADPRRKPKPGEAKGRQGGSTLTMQLARLLYHLNTKTRRANSTNRPRRLWLEARYSKRSILEAYLNLAPFGGNIQGVGAASRSLLRQAAIANRSWRAITLAVIPQRPAAGQGARAPSKAGSCCPRAPSSRTLAATAPTARRNPNAASSNCRSCASADSPLPMHAPHFTDAILRDNSGNSPVEPPWTPACSAWSNGKSTAT
jgi:hypothetical protein